MFMKILGTAYNKCSSRLNTFTYSKVSSLIRRNVHSKSKTETLYEVLKLDSGASQEQIRAQFLKLSKLHHPDVNQNNPRCHHEFIRINEAYNTLSRPLSKREYDISLAAQLQAHWDHIRTVNYYSNPGNHVPGAGTSHADPSYPGDKEERIFWDETIWQMRDKTKDKDRHCPPDAYYGIRGYQKVSNTTIVAGCFLLLLLGTLLHMMAISYSRSISLAVLDEKDRVISEHLLQVKARAKELGNAKQLELLNERMSHINSQQKRPD